MSRLLLYARGPLSAAVCLVRLWQSVALFCLFVCLLFGFGFGLENFPKPWRSKQNISQKCPVRGLILGHLDIVASLVFFRDINKFTCAESMLHSFRKGSKPLSLECHHAWVAHYGAGEQGDRSPPRKRQLQCSFYAAHPQPSPLGGNFASSEGIVRKT